MFSAEASDLALMYCKGCPEDFEPSTKMSYLHVKRNRQTKLNLIGYHMRIQAIVHISDPVGFRGLSSCGSSCNIQSIGVDSIGRWQLRSNCAYTCYGRAVRYCLPDVCSPLSRVCVCVWL